MLLCCSIAPAEHRGLVLGVAESCHGVAGVIGPSLSGWLYEGYGSSAPAAVSGWLCAAAMGIVLAVPLQPPAAKRKPD